VERALVERAVGTNPGDPAAIDEHLEQWCGLLPVEFHASLRLHAGHE
jgi:hypothetical protein